MNTRLTAAIVSLLLSAASITAATFSAAHAVPPNTITIPNDPNFDMKKGLAFTETAEYKQQIDAVVERARKFCEPYVGQPKVAIVVDVDETVLDNREELRRSDSEVTADTPASWDAASFDRWVREARAPQIKQTGDFVRWAKEHHFAVFVITGRQSTQQSSTEANLIREGIPFDEVFTRPLGNTGPAEDFKTDYRRLIESRGYKIVCSIGDQESDLYGLHALDCEKMPNQMYFVP